MTSDATTDIVEPPFDRREMTRRLATETFDVLVIGGGITGAGVALDAAARGLRTALVEADDFGSGTSSKSSKMVHGGLRYLQNGDVRLVYQALRERKRLRDNAPHLVKLLPFLIPITTKHGIIPRRVARALGSAMWMYDLTGGWRIGKLHQRLSADETHRHVPSLPRDRLAGGYLYYDATADDARLVLTVVRSAVAAGAVAANRCRVVGMSGDPITTVRVDTGSGTIDVRAKVVVSATGVWGDRVAALAADGPVTETIRPAKGVHIAVPWSLVRNDVAAVIPVPGDKRSLFVVPWGERTDGTFDFTYVGTTDTDYSGSLEQPSCTADDLAYVLGALSAAIGRDIAPDQVTGTWAGLRPLVRSATSSRTADLSRQHRVSIGPGGLISIAGGKLTTYREMAEDTVDVVEERLGRSGRWSWLRPWRRRRAGTRHRLLLGAEGYHEPAPGTRQRHLTDRYGSLAGTIDSIVDENPAWRAPLVPGLPYEQAEAIYAMRHEMATTLIDVLTRRSRAHLFNRAATVAAAPTVADLMAAELGWDDAETRRQLDAYLELAAAEEAAAHVSGDGADVSGAALVVSA